MDNTTTVGIKNYSQADLGQNPSVNLATGRLRYSFADLSVGNGNFEVGISHVYVSDLHPLFQDKFKANNNAMYGNKWKLNLSQCVMPEGTNYVYLDENGEVHRFKKFDDYRYYDERNAKVVLTVSNQGYEIADGVGNKLLFNTDGMLYRSVSCHNAQMIKEYVYNGGKLVSVYDKRTKPSGSTVAKSRIELTYDANGRLASMTSYGNYNTKLMQLKYTYDADGNLTAVNKVTFDSGANATKQIWQFVYSGEYLYQVVDIEAKSMMQFEFKNGKLIKQSIGTYEQETKVIQDPDSPLGERIDIVNVLKPIKYNSYRYSTTLTDKLATQTNVINENNISLMYYIDRNACITSLFEVVDNKLITLTKQRAKRTGLISGTGGDINGYTCTIITNGQLTLTLPKDFDVARNKNEQEIETFEYAMWLRTLNAFPRMQLYYDYKVKNQTKQSGCVQVHSSVKSAWHRVSIPVTIPKGKTKDLESMSFQFKFNNEIITSSIFINEIGFSPAPHSCMRIPMSGGGYMEYKDIKSITANNVSFVTNNEINSTQFMTEEDIMATSANRAANWYMNGPTKCFDVIYANNTCRKAKVSSLVFKNAGGSMAFGVDSIYYQTYTQINSLDNVVQTDYIHNTSNLTIRQTCSFKNASSDTKTSQASTVVDYKGKTIQETDEYGVSKNYSYDNCGNLTDVKVIGTDNVVASTIHYEYDSEGRLKNTHNGITGQEISYNDYDQVSSVTDGKPTSGSTTLQLTQHHVDNSYDAFHSNVTQVAEYNGTTQCGNNTVTYENGRVRTVTDGTAKYGVKYDDLNKKVEYTQFKNNVETTIQTDQINGQLHTSTFVNGDTTTTKVDNYGKILQVSQNDVVTSVYSYDDPDGTHNESEFARKPTKRTTGTNTTEYCYDYEGELTGFTEKENGARTLEVKQIATDVTRYTYADGKEHIVTVERDQDKMLNPRITAVKYFEDGNANYDDPSKYYEFASNYEYKADSIGQINKKSTLCSYSRTSTTDYVYETVSGNTRLKQSNYSGLCWDGTDQGLHCQNYYNADYSYGDHGEITKITDEVKWLKVPATTPTILKNTREYHYNDLHQLDWEKQGGNKISYEYRTDGRLHKVNGVERKYDSQGRLSSIGNRTFTYDDYGNRSSENINGVTKNYIYQLGLLTNAGGATYKYNADSVRCEKTYNGVTTKYMLDGNKIIGETQTGNVSGLDVSYNNTRNIKYIYDNEGIEFVKIGDFSYQLVKDAFNNVVMVIDQKLGKVACLYRYDAFGKCTVLDANGNVDNDSNSVGNKNPIRWKSFYYDRETGFYYANGSYYDPTTGTYLDAAPVSTMFDNALCSRSLDRNAPVCNNILELAGNPYTVETASGLSPDPTYDAYANAPWYITVRNWVRQAIYDVVKWYKKQHWAAKLGVGIALLVGAVIMTAMTAGSATEMYALAAQFIMGIGFGIGLYLVGAAFTGNFSWEGLANAALDAFLATAAVMFICSAVNFVKHLSRCKNLSTSQLKECATQCFIAGTLVHCEDGLKKIEDVQVGDKVLSYNEETGEQSYKTVLHIFRNESKDWTGITVNDKEIVSTPGHKYYLPLTKQWVSAKDLKVGNTVLLSNGQVAKVQKTRSIHYDTPQTTYNFEVEDFHTYYVETGVLVHNMNCGGGPKSPKKVSDKYIDANDIDAHLFKHKAGKIPKNKIARYDIFQDTAMHNKLWIGNKSQTEWIETEYYFKDLIELWKK